MDNDKARYIDQYVKKNLSSIALNEQLTQYALDSLYITLKKLEIETRRIKESLATRAGTVGINTLIVAGASIEELIIELDNIKQKYLL